MENNTAKSVWDRLPLIEVFRRVIKYFGWRLFAGLVFAVVSLAFFGWLTDEVFEGDTKIFDQSVRDYVHNFASPALTAAMKFFSFVGQGIFLTPLGFIAAFIFYKLGHKRAVVLFAFGMLGELALDRTLKTFFRRARPEAFFDYPLPVSYSFPSGHALGAICFFGILAWLVTARMKNLTAQILIWLTAIFFIFNIGLSRIYLGVHYPSDVAAGYLFGFFWIFVVAYVDFNLRKRDEKSVRISAADETNKN